MGPIFLQRICRNSHTDLNVCGVGYDFLIWSFEETQRLASIGARQVLGQAVSLEYFKMFDYNVF
ncbi:hypothetical protein LEP1GSC021_1266 [Leptospira noguchii str. 1993005606]|nr:hypothetical protein LEP1GSC021_1266 [Leptospira noguchii str. 1993005606]